MKKCDIRDNSVQTLAPPVLPVQSESVTAALRRRDVTRKTLPGYGAATPALHFSRWRKALELLAKTQSVTFDTGKSDIGSSPEGKAAGLHRRHLGKNKSGR